MKHITVLFLSFILVSLIGCSSEENVEEVQAAIESSQTWLKIIDSGNYGDSWDEAAAHLQKLMTKDKWETVITAVREPLGKVVSRKVRGQQFTTTMPGAPDGQYVIIEYTTIFENKEDAVETITPMLVSDGTWKVSGYFVK